MDGMDGIGRDGPAQGWVIERRIEHWDQGGYGIEMDGWKDGNGKEWEGNGKVMG
ncbi:hypothetical protein M419DRAFT_118400 [Trichoderma reesei RUT C-30]|jgi:hypothetical protein|uniref:Uncharacterized protein n=1 Tax=Hypocrea jecorina (strain ATCC 56765 / BCRC 32924 / NRRL 11460 / Rut C-30) TaxID=1344414 RepID=A0A024SGA9_HYPJR|nr:hypothetical protein M419DRAFT_118400 [Trichoderma reesei RUT C-30]